MHQGGEQTSAQGTSQLSTILDRLSLGCTLTAKERMDVVAEGTLGNIVGASITSHIYTNIVVSSVCFCLSEGKIVIGR
jgi:hypothetical protein